MEDDSKLEKFNSEHNKQYSTPPLNLKNQGTPGQPPNVDGLSPEDRRVMLELQAKMAASNPTLNVNKPAYTPPPAYIPPTTTVSTLGSGCPECGVMHPPLPPGQKCPNAKANLESITDQEIGNFLASWRNIIISQIEKRNIKEPRKIFQQVTVVLAKFLEEYKEEVNAEENPTGETQR